MANGNELESDEAITFTCERCPEPNGRGCRHCDGGTATARVTVWAVEIEGARFIRGAEDEERISLALEFVDEHCRPHLEALLRSGPFDTSDVAGAGAQRRVA